MENFEKLLTGMQLHPVADHYTVALLTVAVVIDLIAAVFASRAWLRSTALTLMILGAIAAAASYATGDMEADRIWDMMSPEAHQYFKGNIHFLGHGALGYELMIAFGVLAIWRLLIAMFGFMQESRGLYLLAAAIAVGFLFYQGHTGGELVYRYGVGTGPMASGATPAPTPAPQEAAPLPTVYVPPETPAPAIPTAAASPGPATPPASTSGSLMPPAASASPSSGKAPAARSTAEANL
jgi:uncharacterized membrane protein